MKKQKKICYGCTTLKYIWKNSNGKRYCQTCWNYQKPKKEVIKRQPVKKKSSKRSIQEKLYSSKRRDFLLCYPTCQAGLPGCNKIGIQIHHKKGRVGDLYLDERYWLSVCQHCHEIIEQNPKLAREKGFSLSRLS